MTDSNTNGSSVSDDSCSVRLRGLPWSCKEGEIKKFFSEIRDSIKTVHFTMNREGRPSGEAYVEFASPEAAAKALEQNNNNIGSRYIEVFECKPKEMSFVMKHKNDRDVGEDAIVRLRGLPFGITKEEIAQFFIGLEIVPNGILVPVDLNGRSTGEAFVQFADKDIGERAMEKHMERIGHRYIEVFRSSQDEVKHAMWKLNGPQQPAADIYGFSGAGYGDQYSAAPSPYAMRDSYGSRGSARMSPYARGGGYPSYGGMMAPRMPMKDYSARGRSGHLVHMRGLPFRATEADIREFFTPLQISTITFGTDESGRSNGECDAQFYSHVDAVDAMKKDREMIGSRYVELFLDSVAAPVATDITTGGIGSMQLMQPNFGGMKMF